MFAIPKYNNFTQERHIGEYTIYLPDPPNLKKIDNYGIVQHNQKWRRDPLPKNFNSLPKSDQLEFTKKHWDRRINGYWFFNNGNIEYMTGTNNLYCNWWWLDGLYPHFVDADRDFFYVWDKAEDDHNSTGLIYIADRREGKALDVKTPIPTPDGWKNMGDLNTGDSVFGSDGKPTKVTWVSDIMFNHKCYKVELSDGSHVIADEEHLWIANNKKDRNINQVLSTKQMLNTLLVDGEPNWAIDNCRSIIYQSAIPVNNPSRFLDKFRLVVNITEVPTVPVRCIKVDNSDSSYLCSKDFIVTHNTFKSCCILYNAPSMEEERFATIQSKTDKDAGIVFAKMINSWRRLPPFFKPTDEGLSLPKTALRFFEPSRKDTKGRNKEYEPALNSAIDFLPAIEVAADGLKLLRVFHDEIGKTTRNNVYERWKVVKECLFDGSDIVGKAILTSTVEEMEKGGGKNCEQIWLASDPQKLDDLGRTQTGLMRYFKPADYGLKGKHPVTGQSFIDEYGYSNRELMRSYLMAKRASLEGEDLKSEMRKYPLTITEAFQSVNSECVFDQDILHARREILLNRPKTRRVNFYRDQETGKVKWQDAPINGRWQISWDFEDESGSNKLTLVKGVKKPGNTIDFVAGADPFAHTIITGKGSMACAYVRRLYNDRDPDNSGKAICRYYYRQPLKALMNYDLMLMCEYYGCKINIENNYDDFIEDFEAEGMMHYVMERPKVTIAPNAKKQRKTWGTPSKEGYTNTRHLRALVEDVVNNGHKIDFVELVDDMLEYDPLNRTPFDDTVSYGMSLLGEMEYLVNRKSDEPKPKMRLLKQFEIKSGLY